jgi:poly(3-hydroxybutyrate) depolymerase
MNFRFKALTMGCVMAYLSACSTPVEVHDASPVTSPATQTELLQQATSLAIGNLAWESVRVSEVSTADGKTRWLGTTRSMKYRCSGGLNGENSYCEPGIRIGPAPQMRRREAAAEGGASAPQAAAKAPQATLLSRNIVTVGGIERPYYYYVSSKFRPDAYNPVVYALHDNGQTAEEFAKTSGWADVAEKNGFVVVFPEIAGKSWATNSGGDDDYIKAVYDHASRRLMVPAAGADAAAGGRAAGADAPAGGRAAGAQRGQAGAEARAPGGPGGPPGAMMRGGGGTRVPTWLSFHYITGVGAGATVAQEFVLNRPGVFAALATLNGGAYEAAYGHANEPAQGYFQYMREGKNAKPVWIELKKDVPVAAWLLTTGTSTAAVTKLAKYWRRADAASEKGRSAPIGGFESTAYQNPAQAVQQIRTSTLGDGAKYDSTLVSAIWHDFFEHVGRWPSAPNGQLSTLLTEPEIAKAFDVRTIEIGAKTYKYYVKTPSTYRKGQALPLVLAAHGAFFPATEYMNQIKMHEVGEKEGFITVYLNGQKNYWDFTDSNGSDAQYVLRTIDEVSKAYGVDKRRIYMQGFSLGSGLTYMMGISHSDIFAAVSPNSGIGPMSPEVEARVAEIRKDRDLRIPMMIEYGDVDTGASTDGKVPADGVLRGAIDEIKQLNKITMADKVQRYNSPNSDPYDVLVLGGKKVAAGLDKRYPAGRFQINEYMSSDAVPLNLFSFVWTSDLPHAADPRTAQLEWDYFKQWRRESDGSLKFGVN